jgi:hypothetical protein
MNQHLRIPARTSRKTAFLGAAVACAAVGLSMAACSTEEGSGEIATLTLTNGIDEDVTGLTLLDDFDVRVNIDPDAPQSASLQIDDNLVDDTDIWIDEDGELYVGWADLLTDIEPSERPVLTINVRHFDSVENRSDATIVVTGMDEEDFTLQSSGEGVVIVDGRATEVEIEVEESASVDLADLVAEHVDLLETGDATLRIHATDRVTGTVTAGGDVEVRGGADTSGVELDGTGQLLLV